MTGTWTCPGTGTGTGTGTFAGNAQQHPRGGSR